MALQQPRIFPRFLDEDINIRYTSSEHLMSVPLATVRSNREANVLTVCNAVRFFRVEWARGESMKIS